MADCWPCSSSPRIPASLHPEREKIRDASVIYSAPRQPPPAFAALPRGDWRQTGLHSELGIDRSATAHIDNYVNEPNSLVSNQGTLHASCASTRSLVNLKVLRNCTFFPYNSTLSPTFQDKPSKPAPCTFPVHLEPCFHLEPTITTSLVVTSST